MIDNWETNIDNLTSPPPMQNMKMRYKSSIENTPTHSPTFKGKAQKARCKNKKKVSYSPIELDVRRVKKCDIDGDCFGEAKNEIFKHVDKFSL